MTRKVHSPSLAMVSLLLLGSLQISWAADQQATFSRDISPVLSKKCFQCHGPDQEHRKGDLRLDQPDAEDGPFTNHDGYQSLLPGNLEKSELCSGPLWIGPLCDAEIAGRITEEKALQLCGADEEVMPEYWTDNDLELSRR